MADIAMTYLGHCQTSLIKIFWEESLKPLLQKSSRYASCKKQPFADVLQNRCC